VRVTILGCGTSGGVPRVGGKDGMGEWGAADPADPRNRRRRCSILVEEHGKTVLVDTSPDVRAQLLDAEVERVDAVIWTHEHADQVHGIDDLRPFALRQGPIESWANQRTQDILLRRFRYCFEAEENGFYNPIYRPALIDGPFEPAGLKAIPFLQDHGTTLSLGLRFGAVAYANDVVRLSEEAFSVMAGVTVLIVDAMRFRPHGTHAHLDRALEWIERIGPQRAFLTNLHVDMDYAEVDRLTPPYVRPCYDGLVIEVEGGTH
jgi:phosphoribosyl 1,2-cyclic phosphate phosphodiesterase